MIGRPKWIYKFGDSGHSNTKRYASAICRRQNVRDSFEDFKDIGMALHTFKNALLEYLKFKNSKVNALDDSLFADQRVDRSAQLLLEQSRGLRLD